MPDQLTLKLATPPVAVTKIVPSPPLQTGLVPTAVEEQVGFTILQLEAPLPPICENSMYPACPLKFVIKSM